MNKETFWNPEINDEVEGILVDIIDECGTYKNRLYKIQRGDEVINVWGKKQLNSLMDVVSIGDKILIRYVGTKKVNEYEMKVFELELLNE